MSLAQQLKEYIDACFTAVWIQSFEHEDALAEIAQLCREQDWRLASWDLELGLRSGAGESPAPAAGSSAQDPLSAIRAMEALATPAGSALVVLKNFHRFVGSAEVVQALSHAIARGKHSRVFTIVLAPLVQIPVELEKQFVVLEHALPGREQLLEIARSLASQADELPQAEMLDAVLDAASGLTRYEAEGAFSLSLVRDRVLAPQTIWELKSSLLKKSGLVTLHRGSESFAQLGGLEALKAFCAKALSSRQTKARPRGILLLGVPGTGKSAFAKALGYETGRPTLVLDVGSLMGSLVGQTEEQTRRALKTIDAMGKSIVMIDEVEKALAGVAASGSADSGISARMFGSLLSWLSDHESEAFVICTANDVSKLPPEFTRAERFDGVFFLDLPGDEQKQAIWRLYQSYFELPEQARPVDSDWTGAEIRSCCRLAALLDISLVEAAQNVVPVAVTAAESVERLRTWASARCLAAEQAGVYRYQPERGRARRKISHDPSSN